MDLVVLAVRNLEFQEQWKVALEENYYMTFTWKRLNVQRNRGNLTESKKLSKPKY